MIGTHVFIVILWITLCFERRSVPILRVTTHHMENLIGLVIFLDVFVKYIPVAGIMEDFGAFDLYSASHTYQGFNGDDIESETPAILP